MWLWDPPAGYERTEQWNARPGHGFQWNLPKTAASMGLNLSSDCSYL
jgi:hypothetical protein